MVIMVNEEIFHTKIRYTLKMRKGIATFTLDNGQCPPWLFERMVKLGRSIIEILVDEYGPHEFVKRLGDPVWFQTLGTVLAFDWNASGLTTILTAALKAAIYGQEKDLGIFICGGKGKTSRKTPEQIEYWGEQLNAAPAIVKKLDYSSRMSAKVDSALVQDNYQLYHHAFFFSYKDTGYLKTDHVEYLQNQKYHIKPEITWTVVQQGMNKESRTARRYHWHDTMLMPTEFINEPHTGIASQTLNNPTLDMTSSKSRINRDVSSQLIQQGFNHLQKDLKLLHKFFSPNSQMVSLFDEVDTHTFLKLNREDFKHHAVEGEDLTKSAYLKKILNKLTELKPKTYEQFLSTEGVGAKTVRSLALVAEVIYGAKPSYEDPARYSFAHGGKDKIPYPVDRDTYDETIEILANAVHKSKISSDEKNKAIERLRQ